MRRREDSIDSWACCNSGATGGCLVGAGAVYAGIVPGVVHLGERAAGWDRLSLSRCVGHEQIAIQTCWRYAPPDCLRWMMVM